MTRLRCGEIFSDRCIAYFLPSMSVKVENLSVFDDVKRNSQWSIF